MPNTFYLEAGRVTVPVSESDMFHIADRCSALKISRSEYFRRLIENDKVAFQEAIYGAPDPLFRERSGRTATGKVKRSYGPKPF